MARALPPYIYEDEQVKITVEQSLRLTGETGFDEQGQFVMAEVAASTTVIEPKTLSDIPAAFALMERF